MSTYITVAYEKQRIRVNDTLTTVKPSDSLTKALRARNAPKFRARVETVDAKGKDRGTDIGTLTTGGIAFPWCDETPTRYPRGGFPMAQSP